MLAKRNDVSYIKLCGLCKITKLFFLLKLVLSLLPSSLFFDASIGLLLRRDDLCLVHGDAVCGRGSSDRN